MMSFAILTGVGSAHAADLRCVPDSGQQTFFANGRAQSAPAKVGADDGFTITIKAGGEPDIIWNTPHWDFKSLSEGGLRATLLQDSNLDGNFGLVAGGPNVSYILQVNGDDEAGVRRYLLTTTLFVGAYTVATEHGVCR